MQLSTSGRARSSPILNGAGEVSSCDVASKPPGFVCRGCVRRRRGWVLFGARGGLLRYLETGTDAEKAGGAALLLGPVRREHERIRLPIERDLRLYGRTVIETVE
jgi:hypothetical protein